MQNPEQVAEPQPIQRPLEYTKPIKRTDVLKEKINAQISTSFDKQGDEGLFANIHRYLHNISDFAASNLFAEGCQVTNDEKNQMESPQEFAVSYFLLRMIQTCTAFAAVMRGGMELTRVVSERLPTTLLCLEKLHAQGHPKDSIQDVLKDLSCLKEKVYEQKPPSEETNIQHGIQLLRRIFPPVVDESVIPQAVVPTPEPIVNEAVVSEVVMTDEVVVPTVVLPEVVNEVICRFEQQLRVINKSIPDSQTKRKEISLDLLKAVQKTIGEMYGNKFETVSPNQMKQISLGINDFAKALSEVLLHGDSKYCLQQKFLSVKEFLDKLKKYVLSPLQMCKFIDTNASINISGLNAIRSLLSFMYLQDADRSWEDILSHQHYRGGNHDFRLSIFGPAYMLMDLRRDLEATGDYYLEAAITSDLVGAKLSAELFMGLYLLQVYRSLKESDFDENNVCKKPIEIDITNDGTAYAGYGINVAGIKIFPMKLDNNRESPLHSETVCVPLSVFVGDDNVQNLMLYHSHLYAFFQNNVTRVECTMSIDVGDGKIVHFKIIYLYTGDLKSHALACGNCGLGATSNVDVMYCCIDCHKVSGLLPFCIRCAWCEEFGCQNKSCRHLSFCAALFVLPDQYNEWGNEFMTFMSKLFYGDVVVNVKHEMAEKLKKKQEREKLKKARLEAEAAAAAAAAATTATATTATATANAETTDESVVNPQYDDVSNNEGKKRKRSSIDVGVVNQSSDDNIDEEDINEVDGDVLVDDMNKELHAKYGDKYMHLIDHRSDNKNGGRITADVIKKRAIRESGFSMTEFKTKPDAVAYLQSTQRVRKVVLEKLSNNQAPINGEEQFPSNVYVSLDEANLNELQHFLKIRFCHSKQKFDAYHPRNGAKLVEWVLDVLVSTYGFEPDKCSHLKNNSQNVLTKTRALVYVVSILEQYTVYFLREYNHREFKDGMIDDKMKLIFCTLHLCMRIGETLIENLLNDLIMNKFDSQFALSMLREVQKYLNTKVFRDPNGSGNVANYRFPVKDKVVSSLTVDNQHLVKMLLNVDGIVDVIVNYRKTEQYQHLISKNISADQRKNPVLQRNLINGFNHVMKQLSEFKEETPKIDYITWQLNVVDTWIDSYIHIYGNKHIGYYIHVLARGHVCEQLIRYKDIHKHSQQNWEGVIGEFKKWIATQTQHGGSGGGGKYKQESLTVAAARKMLRNAMYILFPKIEDLEMAMADAKPYLDGKRGLSNIKVVKDFIDYEYVGQAIVRLNDDNEEHLVVVPLAEVQNPIVEATDE